MNIRLAKTVPLVLMVALLVALPALAGGCARKPGFVIGALLDLTGPAAEAGKVHA